MRTGNPHFKKGLALYIYEAADRTNSHVFAQDGMARWIQARH
jgi:hypothetical protein